MKRTPTNTGHGHVHPRPDGVKAKCGGPAMCPVCATDVVEAYAPLVRWRTRSDGNSEWADYTEGDWSVHAMDKDGDGSDWEIRYRGQTIIESGDIFEKGACRAYHFDLAKAAAIGALREAQRALREHEDEKRAEGKSDG